jgi:hypothetical protein
MKIKRVRRGSAPARSSSGSMVFTLVRGASVKSRTPPPAPRSWLPSPSSPIRSRPIGVERGQRVTPRAGASASSWSAPLRNRRIIAQAPRASRRRSLCTTNREFLRHFRIRHAHVGVVTDETHRERLDKPLREGCVDQGDFVRRGTLDVNRDRESAAIGDRYDLRALPRIRLAHAGASLLRWCEAPIDDGFLQIQIAFVVESLGEDLENAPQHTRAHPLLKPPVARLIGGIPVREIGPWGAGPEDPQDAVEHRTILPPRAPPGRLCGAPAWAGRAQSEPIARRSVRSRE